MSSTATPLASPQATDDGSSGAPLAAAPPQPIAWVSFAGGPDESAALFVQSVQRVAFLQNRINDDGWIAQYASTCFVDSALLWYFGLDQDTRSSWERLRVAVVQRYSQARAQPRISSTANSSAPRITDVGRIEVIRSEFGGLFGYLSQDSAGAFVVDPSPDNALRLQKVLHTDSRNNHEKIYSLRLLDTSNTRFPFLGLKLSKLPGEDPDTVPQMNPDYLSLDSNDTSPPWCKTNAGYPFYGRRARSMFATWNFIQTTESELGQYYMRSARGADGNAGVISAVWTMRERVNDVEGLSLVWPKGDERNPNVMSNVALEAVLHNGGIGGLHVHADNFTKGSSRFLDEIRAALIFRHVPSPRNRA